MAVRFFVLILLTLHCGVYSQSDYHSRQNQTHALHFLLEGETSALKSRRYTPQETLHNAETRTVGKLNHLNGKKTEIKTKEARRAVDGIGQELRFDDGKDSTSRDQISSTRRTSIGSFDREINGRDHFALQSSPLGNAETVLNKLKHSEHYGRVRVMDYNGSERIYLPPHDFSRCGRCLCFNPSANQRIHADCKRIKGESFHLVSIPQDLPFDTACLQMDGNPIKRFETYKLAMYKSLRRVDATGNKIEYLSKSDCQFDMSITHLDLSLNQISSLEDGALSCMPKLTVLILNNNRIINLTNGSFSGLVNLRVLDLAFNQIHHIQTGTFLNSQGLQRLDLSMNKQLSLSGKHIEVFKPLSALEVFHTQGCKSFGRYPTDVLLHLPALRELHVNGEREPFDARLSALKNLTKLAMGTYREKLRYCWVKNFTKSYFNGLHNLESLIIDGCRPHTYSPFMFDANPRLKNFTILQEICDVKTLFSILCYFPKLYEMKSVQIRDTIKHTALDPLIVLTSKQVKCLSNMTSLEYLNLDQNTLSKITRKFNVGLPASLETLSVRSNILISAQSLLYQLVNIRGVFPNLKNLYEDMQGVQRVKSREINDEPRVSFRQGLKTQLYIDDHAPDTSVDLCTEEAQRRLLSIRQDSKSNSNPTEDYVAYNYSHKYVKIDKYSANMAVNLGILIFQNAQSGNIQVGILKVSNTMLTDWGIYPVLNMPSMTVIADLSENRCESFQMAFFKANNSLIEFHAQGNFLGPFLSKDTMGSQFSRLTNLEYLDLSRNHLYTLPWLLFQGMPRLRILKLRLNDIDVVDIHIAHMTSLVFLDLARNSISSISKRTRGELDYLASKGHIYVDLTFNPLPCTCEGFELLKWMSETQVHILNKDILLCFDGNKQKEFVGNLPDRIIALKRECITKRLLIMACSFSFAILLLLTGFVLVFQKRWWIIYMRNRAISYFYGHRKSHKKPASPYTFDAFFVYAATGCDFVLDECLEELEENRGHRLCVEDRDFLAGSYVPCNITSAVRSSRTTVVVLDEHFQAEGWVQYAVEMAQVEAVRSKRDVLHLLFVGSPADGCLPGAYLKVLRQGRFSEVPPKESPPDVRKKFWDTFSQLLGHTDHDRPYPMLEIND